MTNKQITYQDIVDLKPCYSPDKYLSTTWTGTLTDILNNKEIPPQDRIWVVVRQSFIDDKSLLTFGLKCARLVEHLAKSPTVKECNDATEAYLAGTITLDALKIKRDAAYATAAAAAPNAAYAAAYATAAAAAAPNAVYAAVYATAAYAADAASTQMREQQVTILVEMINQGDL